MLAEGEIVHFWHDLHEWMKPQKVGTLYDDDSNDGDNDDDDDFHELLVLW